MAIERQAVQGLQQVQSAGLPQRAGTQPLQLGTPELSQNSLGFVNDLLTASGELGQAMTLVKQQAVEDDKVLQTNRALQGLLPTETATQGGKRAHMLVGLQNEVSAASLQLEDDAKRWQGTDDEWNQHVVQTRNRIQSSTYQKYPELATDKESMKLITNSFLEQSPKVFASRAMAKIDKEARDRANSMQSRILLATTGVTGAALSAGISVQLKAEAGAMGLTEEEYEGLIAQTALDKASTGDTSLIEATKELKNKDGVSLYEREGKLQTAMIQGLRMNASLNQAEMADKKWDVETRYNKGEINDSQLSSEADRLNGETGGTAYSDSEINSLRRERAKLQGKQATLDNAVSGIMGGRIIGLDAYSPEDMGKIAAGVRKRYDDTANTVIKQRNLDPNSPEAMQIKQAANSQAAVALAKSDVKDETFIRQVKAFSNLSPDHLKDMTKEPEELQAVLQQWDSFPEQYRNSIVDAPTAAFLDNYATGLKNSMTPGQAIDFAQKAGKPRNFSSEENKAISKGVKAAIDEVGNGSGWNPFDNMPDSIKAQMEGYAGDVYRSYRKAGYDDDGAQKATINTLKTQWSRQDNSMMAGGTIIKGNVDTLAGKLRVNSQDMGMVFQGYLQLNKQHLEDASGGHELSDMYIDVDQKRGVFRVMSSTGMPITSATPLRQLDGPDLLRKAVGMSDEDKMEADARMANNYVKAMGKGVDLNASNYPTFKQLNPEAQVFTAADDQEFHDYLASAENGQSRGYNASARTYEPYDSDEATNGADTVGYGHKITPQERRDGYIMVDGNPVPFTHGQSQMTDEVARKLMVQDINNNAPSTEGWKVPKDKMPAAAWRAILDSSYNMGGGFLNKSPQAKSSFEQGKFGDGFVQLLSNVNENDKRNTGLLLRRARAYNMYASSILAPRITAAEVNPDGSMRVKFDRKPEEGLSKSIVGKIDDDGWYNVLGSKQGSLHPRSSTGRFKV